MEGEEAHPPNDDKHVNGHTCKLLSHWISYLLSKVIYRDLTCIPLSYTCHVLPSTLKKKIFMK